MKRSIAQFAAALCAAIAAAGVVVNVASPDPGVYHGFSVQRAVGAEWQTLTTFTVPRAGNYIVCVEGEFRPPANDATEYAVRIAERGTVPLVVTDASPHPPITYVSACKPMALDRGQRLTVQASQNGTPNVRVVGSYHIGRL